MPTFDIEFFASVSNLVISTDNSIEGVHVPIGTDVQIQARRSVLRALSDIATFGADPFCIFSSISPFIFAITNTFNETT